MRTRRRIVGLVGLLALLWLARPTTTRRLLSFTLPSVAVPAPATEAREVVPLVGGDEPFTMEPLEPPPIARHVTPAGRVPWRAPDTREPDTHSPGPDEPDAHEPPGPPSLAPIDPDGALNEPPLVLRSEPPIPWSSPDPTPAPTEAPTRPAPDPHAMTDELRAGMRDRDLRVGHALPAAHTIAQALAMSVRRHTPPVARTWYRARLSSDGELLGIEVASYDPSEGARSRWQDAADEVVAELGKRRFRMPHGSYGSGAIVNIRIDSNLEHPSGYKRERRPTPAMEAPLERWAWPWNPGPAKEPVIHDRLRPVPIVISGDPLGTVDIYFPTCITTLVKTCPPPIGARDLSDIGTHPLRVVHTHVEIEPVEPEHGPRR